MVQQVSRRLLSFLWDLELDFLDDDGEGEHEDTHEKEEAIADHVGQEDLVRHRDVGNPFVGRVTLRSDPMITILTLRKDPRPGVFGISSRDDRLFSLTLYCPKCLQSTTGVFISSSFFSFLVLFCCVKRDNVMSVN